MRIVITKLGKNEIKKVDYEVTPTYNNLTHRCIRTKSYDKHKKQIIINDINKDYKIRNNNSLHQKIEYTQFPSINKNLKNLNTIDYQNNHASILSQAGEFSIKPQEFKTPKKIGQHLKLNKNNINNINILKSPNKNKTLFNSYNSNYENVFRKIKINQKKLNIPLIMIDKYTEKSQSKKNNINSPYLFNNNEDSKINNSENSLTLDNNKMYSLREILLPKNQKNVEDSFLDKKINSKGGESIISYLQMDKDISPSLIKKINKYNTEKIHKLDKICQKYFNDEKNKTYLDNEIKQKIKKEYELDSIFCKNNLNDMNTDLNNYNILYRKLRLKKDNYKNSKNI